jgi:hypothetical protein
VPWRPSEPGEVPTLGWQVIDWMTAVLAAPDSQDYEPFVPYLEQEDFLLRLYELDPVTGRRRYVRGLLGRPRGWGKSPLLAALAAAEALGPVVFDGWDAAGQPVGKPWSEVRTPLVHIAAVSEQQTGNTWSPLLEMLRDGPACDEYPGLDPMDTFVALPRGRIEQVTSSARTVKGARALFAVLDQTEEWVPSNGGPNLAKKMRVNAAKVGGSTVESPNAFTPGDNSVAEASANYYRAMVEGRLAHDSSLLYDHREAPGETDLDDYDSLMHGLRIAYGDSSSHSDGCLLHQPPCAPGHADLERLIVTIRDPDQDEEETRSDFLNQITATADAWLSQPDWKSVLYAAEPAVPLPSRGDTVVLGFDGSRGRSKGKPDATALVGCRISDGLVFSVGVWEAPDRADEWPRWSPPMPEIEAALEDTFRRYSVVGFFADPGRDWRSHVNAWEAKYGPRLKVKATRDHPIEWWMTGGRAGLVESAIEQCEGAILNRDLRQDGSYDLTRHVLNARRRKSHGRLALGKESPSSSKKIDAAVAMVLAWQARLAAVSAGVGQQSSFVPSRIR